MGSRHDPRLRLPQGALVRLPEALGESSLLDVIVRDNRSPHGRYEESPPRPYTLPNFLLSGREAGGVPWREQNRTGEARARLFGPRVRPPFSNPVVTMQCEECPATFQTQQPKLAKVCGATCRQRRYKRAHQDEIRARRQRSASAA